MPPRTARAFSKAGYAGFEECGPCVSAPDMEPSCPCVGTAPSLYTQCCGNGCGNVEQTCDWCASNNHPHFDLDTATFNKLCGEEKSAGSCKLSSVGFVACATAQGWPPGGGGGATCKANSFQCAAAMPNQPQVPGTGCCCNFGLSPQADGRCQ